MKRILLIIALLPVVAFAQILSLPREQGKITYIKVIEVQGSVDDLHSRAAEWFARYYTSSDNVIQVDEHDKMIGKALLPVYRKGLHGGNMHYTIKLEFKEGKYRYIITDFYHTNVTGQYGWGSIEKMYDPTSAFNRRTFDGYLRQTDETIKALTESLSEAMQSAQTLW